MLALTVTQDHAGMLALTVTQDHAGMLALHTVSTPCRNSGFTHCLKTMQACWLYTVSQDHAGMLALHTVSRPRRHTGLTNCLKTVQACWPYKLSQYRAGMPRLLAHKAIIYCTYIMALAQVFNTILLSTTTNSGGK